MACSTPWAGRRTATPRDVPDNGDGLAGLDPGSLDPAVVEQALTCGRFRADICAAYQTAASTGTLTPEIAAVLDRSSPAGVLDRIEAPTLLVQGTQDSLFGLGQADANARGIAANGTPVKVVWYAGGHDSSASDRVIENLRDADRRLVRLPPPRPGRGPGHRLRVPCAHGRRGPPAGSASRAATRRSSPAAIRAWTARTPPSARPVALSGPTQPVVTPAGGTPAALTTVPGLGSLAAALGGTTLEIPGQFAAFESEPLDAAVEVVGAPTVEIAVSAPGGTATLFAKLYDVAPGGGTTLPAGLVAPLALTGLSTDPTDPTPVEVTLPGIVHRFEAGHTMRLVVSSTDQAYALPAESAVYSVALAGGSLAEGAADLAVPQVEGRTETACGFLAVVGAARRPRRSRRCSAGAWRSSGAGAGAGGSRRSSRTARRCRCASTGVTKAYKDGFVAVRDLSFEVRRGQVLGLLGPNGAGKTTSLRMLMGLIRPTEGRISIFGHAAGPARRCSPAWARSSRGRGCSRTCPAATT